MNTQETDLVRVATGSTIEIKILESTLIDAGVNCRVVGEHLDGGLGTALPSSVELLVQAADFARATNVIENSEHHRPQIEKQHFAHPTSDPKPDNRARGPQHGSPPHRPLGGD